MKYDRKCKRYCRAVIYLSNFTLRTFLFRTFDDGVEAVTTYWKMWTEYISNVLT